MSAGHGAQRGGPVEGQKFTPAGDHGGWRYGEDVVDKPGWICCGEGGGDGPPSITFHVNAPRGNVRVGFLRSYAGNMGRALFVVRAARNSDGKPLGRLTAAGRMPHN